MTQQGSALVANAYVRGLFTASRRHAVAALPSLHEGEELGKPFSRYGYEAVGSRIGSDCLNSQRILISIAVTAPSTPLFF